MRDATRRVFARTSRFKVSFPATLIDRRISQHSIIRSDPHQPKQLIIAAYLEAIRSSRLTYLRVFLLLDCLEPTVRDHMGSDGILKRKRKRKLRTEGNVSSTSF